MVRGAGREPEPEPEAGTQLIGHPLAPAIIDFEARQGQGESNSSILFFCHVLSHCSAVSIAAHY